MAKPKCSDLSRAITDLAMTLGSQPGVNTLDKVVVAMQSHVPGIKREMVVDAIVEATSTQRGALSEVAQQIAALKREARQDKALLKQIGELADLVADGKRPPGTVRKNVAPEAIKRLRKIRNALRKIAGASEAAVKRADDKAIAAVEAQIATMEKHLADGTLPKSAGKRATNVSARLADLRAKRTEMKKAMRDSAPARKKRLLDEINRLANKLESAKYVPPVDRSDAPAHVEFEELAFERDQLKRAIRGKIKSLKPLTFFEKIAEPVNLARAMMTSMDFSAVFRQGGFIVLGDVSRVLQGKHARLPAAARAMLVAARSEQASDKINADILKRPNAPMYARAKLFLADELSNQEETFMSKIAGKVPGVAGSQRAYITFLNVLRADSFDAMVETLTLGGEVTLEEAKAIAGYINSATGRANLGKTLEQAAPFLATTFFAPRLVASRFQILAGHPLFGGNARTRKLIAKEYARFLSGIGLVYMLGALAGGDLEEDPRSSDFGKIKFGRTRIDPLGGLAQVSVLLGRLGSGEKKSSVTGRVSEIRGKDIPFGGDTSADVIARFLRSKLSPVIGGGVNILSGQNVVGEEVTALPRSDEEALFGVNPGEIGSMLIPLSFRDIYDSLKEHGVTSSAALTSLSLLGFGIQTFGPDLSKPGELGRVMWSLSAPSADSAALEAISGVSEADAIEALKTHERARAEKADREPKFTSKAFVRRKRKMLEGLRKAR